MYPNSREKGADAEKLAAEYLKTKGYAILKMNYYTKDGEIDIIAEKDEVLAFVEVKYRADLSFGYPSEAVTKRKMRRIAAAAEYYIDEFDKEDSYYSFDIIEILGRNKEITHIEDAFNLDDIK